VNRTLHALLLALFLSAIGLVIFIHKVRALDVPLLPNQAYRSWYVEAKLSLNSDGSLLKPGEAVPTTIQLQLPQKSQRYKIVDEDFLAKGFNHQIENLNNSVNRLAVFTNKKATGDEILFYRAIVRRRSDVTPGTEEVPILGRRVIHQRYSRFTQHDPKIQDNLKGNLLTPEISSLLDEAKQHSSDPVYVAAQVYQLASHPDDIRVQAIRRTLGLGESTPELAAFLLSKANIPARIGNGILLRSNEVYSTNFVQWLEINVKNRWLAYDPINFGFGEQDRYLTWWYGPDGAVKAKGLQNITLEVVVEPNINKGLTREILQGNTGPALLEYSFLNLPLGTQHVFQVLVLVPIGALVISILHQIVGLETFGTFTPILIALAFRQTGLLAGIPLFGLVVIVGLLIRAYLNRLQLLIVPRLAAMLAATVLVMGAIALIMERLDINLGLSVSLFPIVILAMTIERTALMWEENGPAATLKAALGTVLAGSLGYFCISNSYIQHWAFTFPELLLVVLALNILVGRYNGFKLMEYIRFRSLQRQLNQTQG